MLQSIHRYSIFFLVHANTLHRLFPSAKFDEPLKRYTAWKIGGPADALLEPGSVDELISATEKAAEHDLPVTTLAGLEPGDRLLEIGSGTGKATRPLLERGFSVVCVELGAQLAEQARRNLAGLPVEVETEPFETWSGEPKTFDLVYAATAWHWLDPAIRYGKAHQLLRPGGHLAFCERAGGMRFRKASIPSSARSKRSMTPSVRATLTNGHRLRRTISPTTGKRSRPAASSKKSSSGATSGRRPTRRMSTSPSSTPSQAISPWRLRNGGACTARSDSGSTSAMTGT